MRRSPLTFARLVAILGDRDQAARLVREAAGQSVPGQRSLEKFERDEAIRAALDEDSRNRVPYGKSYKATAQRFGLSRSQVENIAGRAV